MKNKKTVLITGGTQGLGKAMAIYFLRNNCRVIVVGSSQKKGDVFIREQKNPDLSFIQADLSLVKDNNKVINELEQKYNSLDILMLCAQSQSVTKHYKTTEEGFEFLFGLYYLSRFILSYGLKNLLSQSANPMIVNICGTDTSSGKINWDDIQLEHNYQSLRAIMHVNRLHNLAAIAFNQNNSTKVKYILYNPGIVKTEGALEAFSNPIMRMLIKIIGKNVQKAIQPLIHLLQNTPDQKLSAFKQKKQMDLSGNAFDRTNAEKLYKITANLLVGK